MKQRKFYQGLKGKLILIFLGVGIIPLAIAAVIAIVLSSNALQDEAIAKLKAVHQIKTNQISGYFGERKGDVIVLSDNLTTRDAMKEFTAAFPTLGGTEKAHEIYITKNPHKAGEKDKLDTKDDQAVSYSTALTGNYNTLHKKYHRIFREYLVEYGYYDIFLVDNGGNVVYTVFKELDFATNLISGKYKGDNIADAYRAVKDKSNETVALVDFKMYTPSNTPASFIATPIYDKGQQIGTLIFQMPISKMNEIMLETAGMGETGETYLVGKGYMLRTGSRFDIKGDARKVSKEELIKLAEKDVLNKDRIIKTEPIMNVFANKEVKPGLYKDYRGNPVLGVYGKVNVLGLEWAVVAEIDKPEALAAVSNITMWIIGVAIIISVLVAIIGLFIGTSFAKPILAGAQFSTAISQRDLTQTLHTKITSDEIGEMSQALVTMNKNLQDVVIEMSEVSATLAATSEEINAAATNLSEGAQNQAASVEETSASTEELTSSIKQVSDHTLTMQTKSEKSLSEAQAYKINMNQVSEEMVNISQSTEKIGDIVKVINDIADQTNLLSLNAAIEAARAGEHGRGFAVVAEAISTLATRSADSTKEIEKLVGETISRINKGVDSVKRSSDSFTAIISTIEENNGIVNEITKSMEDQHQGSEQIQKATEEINNLTQNISASAEEMASSTSELHNLAERLNGIVGTFKSKNGDSHHITQKVKLAITNDSKKKAVNT